MNNTSGLRTFGVIFVGVGLFCILRANRLDLIESQTTSKKSDIIDAIFEVVDD